jgi:hypothetical protein
MSVLNQYKQSRFIRLLKHREKVGISVQGKTDPSFYHLTLIVGWTASLPAPIPPQRFILLFMLPKEKHA